MVIWLTHARQPLPILHEFTGSPDARLIQVREPLLRLADRVRRQLPPAVNPADNTSFRLLCHGGNLFILIATLPLVRPSDRATGRRIQKHPSGDSDRDP